MTLPPVPRFAHQAMGTVYEVFVAGEDPVYAAQAARAAFAEIDRLERLFSRFDPASEIARLNRLGAGESLAVGVETFECLSIAERMRADTAGAFDVNWKRSSTAGAPLALGRTGTGFEAHVLETPEKFARPLDLDLGAIGKGFALDRALEVLIEWGVGNALLHGGTSTAIAVGAPEPGPPGASESEEEPDGTGWPVGVGGGWPCDGAPRELRLTGGRALSGSGTEVKGRHIKDPRTGEPAGGHIAAWAIAGSGAEADALSTAFMVMDTAAVEAYCQRRPDVWALVIRAYGDGRLFGNR
jgi:thiamine biosynthesis lipoprotein